MRFLFLLQPDSMRAGEAGSVPRTAAVLHNDCVYLAHESSLLGESPFSPYAFCGCPRRVRRRAKFLKRDRSVTSLA